MNALRLLVVATLIAAHCDSLHAQRQMERLGRGVVAVHQPDGKVAWQNVAYNQPPHTSFYLDEAAALPAWPKITVAGVKP